MNLDLPQLPDWIMKVFVGLACIGAGVALFGFCLGVAWVIRHLRWV